MLLFRQVSYGQAVDWYLRAISASQHENSDDFDATIDHPVYQLQAKVAELYLQGGPDLDKDPQSAGRYLLCLVIFTGKTRSLLRSLVVCVSV